MNWGSIQEKNYSYFVFTFAHRSKKPNREIRPYDLPETALVVAERPSVLLNQCGTFISERNLDLYFLCEMSVEDKNNDNNNNNTNHNDNPNKNNPEQQKQQQL